MKLTISATLTDEQVLILAKAKWRSEKVWVGESDDMSTKVEVNNPQTASDFVVAVYQSMIVDDATKIFTDYRTEELKKQIAQTWELVKTDVTSAITSSIE